MRPLIMFDEIKKLCGRPPLESPISIADILPFISVAKIVLFSIIGLDSYDLMASYGPGSN